MGLISTCAELDDLGGGHFRHTAYLKPVAWDKPGIGLRRIVSDWMAGDASFPHVVSEAKISVLTAPNGDRRICPVPSDLNAWASISAPYVKVGGVWQQPNLGSFSRSVNLLSAVNPNVNTYIQHCSHYIKAGFLLKGGWRPEDDQFAFRVDLQGLTRSGGVLSYAGRPELIIRPPVVYDLQNPDDTRSINWIFTQLSGETYILFTLPSLVGMAQPFVDPTFTDGFGGDIQTYKDTYINSGAATVSYGVNALIQANSTGIKALLEFDLSSIDAAATCNSALFSVYRAVQGSANAYTLTTYSIASGNAAWVEGTSANPAPSGSPCWNALAADGSGGVTTAWAGSAGLATPTTDYETSALGTVNGNRSDAVGTEYQTSLTPSRVAGWFGGSNTNYGVLVITSAADGNIASSDNTDTTLRPKVVVDWTAAGGKPWYAYAQQ